MKQLAWRKEVKLKKTFLPFAFLGDWPSEILFYQDSIRELVQELYGEFVEATFNAWTFQYEGGGITVWRDYDTYHTRSNCYTLQDVLDLIEREVEDENTK